MKLKELLHFISALAKQHDVSTPYIVGGTVRDKVLKRLDKISDLDITTGDSTVKVLAKELSLALENKFQVDVKTMADGHTSIFMGDLKVDFSSNFQSPHIFYHLNKMGINNPTDMQQEMFSRDFTCNALLLDFDLKTIIDPTGKGMKDIEDKIIKTCLSPDITLSSNKNRVVRAIYLAAKLGFEIDEEIVNWVKKNPQSIKNASKHTLTEKLNGALQYDSEKTVHYLDAMGLWGYIPVNEQLYPWYKERVK